MIHEFFLTEWFFDLLRWLYGALGNSYFWAIFLTTFALRLVQVFPDITSRKSQRKQAALQPKIEELQKRYSNNPQKLQQEQAKLMKENGIGMLSGCLPLLLTLPIFFCFLAAFRFWGYEQTLKLTYETIVCSEQSVGEGQDTLADETYKSFRFAWITNIWQPDNGFSPVVTSADEVAKYGKLENLVLFHRGYVNLDGEKVAGEDIWHTLCDYGIAEGDFGTENMKLLPNAEAKEKYDDLMGGYKKGYNNGLFILPVLAAAFQLLASWLMMRQQKQTNPSAAGAAGSMNFMTWLFPIMSFWFCLNATSAFALYWVLSSIFQIISSATINFFMKKKYAELPSNKRA